MHISPNNCSCWWEKVPILTSLTRTVTRHCTRLWGITLCRSCASCKTSRMLADWWSAWVPRARTRRAVRSSLAFWQLTVPISSSRTKRDRHPSIYAPILICARPWPLVAGTRSEYQYLYNTFPHTFLHCFFLPVKKMDVILANFSRSMLYLYKRVPD